MRATTYFLKSFFAIELARNAVALPDFQKNLIHALAERLCNKVTQQTFSNSMAARVRVDTKIQEVNLIKYISHYRVSNQRII